MVRGSLRPQGAPLVPIEVAGQLHDAILDTGFEYELQLPNTLASLVPATFQLRQPFQYGDGRIGWQDVYEVVVHFDGEDCTMRTIFSDSNEVLLGVEALKGYRLEINFVTGSVVLERVATP